MAQSENGWTVLDIAPPAQTIPGTDIRIRVRPGDVATILLDLAGRFHDEVEPLTLLGLPDEWGWAVRKVRGSLITTSNHASGTAIDLNATRHPRGVKGTFPVFERAKVRKILASYFDARTGHSVVRWGEDYTGTIDGMHFEIHGGPEAVARVAERIRLKAVTPIAAPITPEDDVSFKDEHNLTEADVAAYGQKTKVGDKKSYDELVRFPPATARLRREVAARDEELNEKLDGLLKKVDSLVTLLSPPAPGSKKPPAAHV